MLTLIKTLIDICLLRAGPDALPRAWVVFYATLFMWILGIIVLVILIPNRGFSDVSYDVAGWLFSNVLFAIVVAAAGFPERLLQCLSAIIGAGAVILYVQVAVAAVTLPFGAGTTAPLLIELLLFWAVFVKGNIVAKTINVHWLIGLAISVIVYIMRLIVSISLAPAP